MPEISSVSELLNTTVTALGGEHRAGQHALAAAVADALDTGVHLLVQAGTGTGKSLGYLVPTVRHAVMTDQAVVVSTATLALQRQLLTRDLPTLASAIADELPRPATFALVKGRHHYVCQHKLMGGYPVADASTLFDLDESEPRDSATVTAGGPVLDLGASIMRLREWAEITDTGDRDDLVPGVPDRAWQQVSVTAFECLGTKCPQSAECFAERARMNAAQSDVVVTNHTMLALSALGHPVLPNFDALVVDEAHELADRVTSAISVSLTIGGLHASARSVRRGAGVVTERLDEAIDGLAPLLEEHPAGRMPGGLSDELRDALTLVRSSAREIAETVQNTASASAEPDGGRKVAQSAMQSIVTTVDAFVEASESDVIWFTRQEETRFGAVRPPSLELAPVRVGALIRDKLLVAHTTVFTSATLTLGGNFDAEAVSVGLDAADRIELGRDSDATDREPHNGVDASPDDSAGSSSRDDAGHTTASNGHGVSWRGLDVGSPFDYRSQGILYIAKHLPPPGRNSAIESQLDELAALIESSNGRTLGLFSSKRAAIFAAEELRQRLSVPILLQGDDVLPTLVEQFTASRSSCLFGTLSLWQGVDVPGKACQLVVIDRIPFPRPDDPLASARTESVEATGGNGFLAISATHAALLLAQGSGRLIRSTNDRGVVAVLDSRLATARYGRFLLRSMPDFWLTTDRNTVLQALSRLSADESAT